MCSSTVSRLGAAGRENPEVLLLRVRAAPGRPLIPAPLVALQAGTVPSKHHRREKTMNDIHQWFRREGLTRPRHSRLLAGVVAGLLRGA